MIRTYAKILISKNSQICKSKNPQIFVNFASDLIILETLFTQTMLSNLPLLQIHRQQPGLCLHLPELDEYACNRV
jgi:hypothetical protein